MSSMFQTWNVICIQEPEHKSASARPAGDLDFIREIIDQGKVVAFGPEGYEQEVENARRGGQGGP
ncbi:uncharacterized protein N7525_004986 [Penicillium rubens]|jgi:hypothetical protein|nr:uncharacterized protein N7525_004986 [Penicillium rubens]KAJ5839798.1 hypothetical protein N7525_004986 [Penicillium rubens]KAJ5867793.1 hypothetical protein N7534_002346 [Penicillium rubens]